MTLIKKPEVLAGLPALPFLPPVEVKEESALTLRQALQSVFRGKGLLAATTIAGLLVGAAVALGQPNVYRSLSKMLVLAGGHEGTTPDLLRINPDGSRATGVALRGNAIEMLQDDALHRRVVAQVGAPTILKPYDPRQRRTGGIVQRVIYAFQAWLNNAGATPPDDQGLALTTFKANLRVEAPQETDFIAVSYTANDAELAKTVLEATVKQAIARHVETYSNRSAAEIARRDTERARTEQEAAFRALEAFKTRNQIENYVLQMQQAERQATTGEGEAGTLKATIEINQKRIRDLDERLGGLPDRIETETSEVVPNSTLIAYQEQVDRLTRERVEQAQRLREGDPALERLDHQIADYRSKIETERQKPPELRKVRSLAPNPEREQVRRVREELSLTVEVDQARLATQQAMRDRARTEMTRLSGLTNEYNRLETAVTTAGLSVTAAQRILAVAEKELELVNEGISSLRVTQDPTLPLEREGPRRARVVFGGFLVGLFAGLGVLILRALTDPTVRGPEDLERGLGVRLLAAIPELRGRVHVNRHQSLRVTSWS